MRLTTVPTRVGQRAARARRAAALRTRRLAGGIPTGFVAGLAVLVLVAILFTVATRDPKETRGYAEVTLFPDACAVDMTRQLNARDCLLVGPGTYRLSFTESLQNSTAVASRGSCCPGRIAVSVETDRSVLLVVPRRFKDPIRVSVVLP
jgi:hypothetical protein